MNIKQFVQNKDTKLKLFNWAWATEDTEKYRIYNALLDDFLAKPEISVLKYKPKILFYWHLYAAALQNYALNGKVSAKLEDIVKQCPLSEQELKRLFYEV